MNTIICINRQFASGGLEIGKILAERLNIPLYDSEIIDKCVEKTGINKKLVHSHDEKASASLLYSIAMGTFGNHYIETPGDTVFNAQANVIREFADKGACIIVGRCAGEILRDHPWDSINSFDLTINVSCCGLEGAASVITAFIEQCEK